MPHKIPSFREAMTTYLRIGRWGTCADCRRSDSDGVVYSEFCMYTDRYDHQLTFEDIIVQYKYLKDSLERMKDTAGYIKS